jgi:2,3,4,5-tetrahydropyridine-2,6-dicarboxylate N-succinyltransferase
MSETSGATAEGYATVSRSGVVLDSWFPEARLVAAGGRSATTRLHHSDLEGYARSDEVRRVEIVPVRTDIASLQDAPVDVHDAYLRLHLLSQRDQTQAGLGQPQSHAPCHGIMRTRHE